MRLLPNVFSFYIDNGLNLREEGAKKYAKQKIRGYKKNSENGG